MAISVSTVVAARPAGSRRELIADITLDSSYPTGGYAITPDQIGFSQVIDTMHPAVAIASSNFIETAWNPSTKKLMCYYPTGGGASAPASVAQPVGATGGTTVTSTAATLPLVPGAGKEVANATDLSAFSVRVIAFGL